MEVKTGSGDSGQQIQEPLVRMIGDGGENTRGWNDPHESDAGRRELYTVI